MKQKRTHDPVNSPAHYNRTTLETIDVMLDMVKGWKAEYAVLLATTLKYIWRHNDKGTPLQDLRKARWYLDRAITLMEKEESSG